MNEYFLATFSLIFSFIYKQFCQFQEKILCMGEYMNSKHRMNESMFLQRTSIRFTLSKNSIINIRVTNFWDKWGGLSNSKIKRRAFNWFAHILLYTKRITILKNNSNSVQNGTENSYQSPVASFKTPSPRERCSTQEDRHANLFDFEPLPHEHRRSFRHWRLPLLLIRYRCGASNRWGQPSPPLPNLQLNERKDRKGHWKVRLFGQVTLHFEKSERAKPEKDG